MDNKRLEFDNAVREVIAMEFTDIPRNEDEIDLAFSPKFEAKMEKLIAKEKNSFWRITNTRRKRLAVILVVIMVLFTTACSIDAIRESIVNFIMEVTDAFYDFIYNGEVIETISYEYQLVPVPDGFVEVTVERTDSTVIRTYIDGSGNQIVLSQNISADTTVAVDSEKGTITTVTVNDVEAVIYEYDNFAQAVWASDSYVFLLIYYGDIDIDTMQDIISSVK